ncbi:hypothetical protein J0J23_22750, partial [Vibrio vulnificus]|uniref:hypothetical protein n=1 Tax=Vibrio vulnificus TaxID=672 RepID=UPI0019D45953
LEDVGKELIAYVEGDRNFEKLLSVPCGENEKALEMYYGGELPSNGSVVQGLMASENCPWRSKWNVQNNHHTLLSGGIR